MDYADRVRALEAEGLTTSDAQGVVDAEDMKRTGLRVEIYRGRYDSELNFFHGVDAVTVVNVDGPFEPMPWAPAAMLSRNAFGDPIIVPADARDGAFGEAVGPMMGGTYAGTSDGRFGAATGIYGAIPIHDRFESPVRS